MTSVDSLARRLEAAGKNMRHAERQGVNAAAAAVALAARAELSADTHGTLILRGVSGGRAKLGVQVKPSTGTANYAAFVRGVPGGLWHWLAAGTKPHMVGVGRKRRGRKPGRGQLMRIGDDVATGPFMAGGSPAKHTFARGVDKVRPLIPRLVQREVAKVLRDSFR